MNKNGFTIIELLIASGILASIIVGMVIMLSQQQRQFNFTREISDIDVSGRNILDLIAGEIRNAGASQGKAFSLKFVNGGSTLQNPCTQQFQIPGGGGDNSLLNSPPDCLTIYTWDATLGMSTFDPGGGQAIDLPSTAASNVFLSEESTEGELLNRLSFLLPQSWSVQNDVIDPQDNELLVGFRSRESICNNDLDIRDDCLTNDPTRCSECAVIFNASIAGNTITIDHLDDVAEHNFPEDNDNRINDLFTFINGHINRPDQNYGFMSLIHSTPYEFTIVKTRRFDVDIARRGLRMATTLNGPSRTIAGGTSPGNNTPNFLEEPGIVDLQFVFNLQDPDGGTTRVGICDDGNCNDPDPEVRIFSDFNQPQTIGREQDIRSVDITLVLKSKIRPQQQTGNFYEQRIPAIADVSERRAPSYNRFGQLDSSGQSIFNEPERGFIYRIYTTTVYLRNFAREEPNI